MTSVKQIRIEIGRILRFGVVGIAAALVYFCATFGLVQAGTSPLAATLLGHGLAALTSYFGHQNYSFAVAADHRTYGVRFAVITLATVALNLAVTWLFTSVLAVSYLYSVAVVTVLVPAANYLGNRFWVFMPGLRPVAAGAAAETAPARASDPPHP